MTPLVLLYPLVILRFTVVNAVPKNRTIDDTFGDPATGAKPIFLPAGDWNGPECPPANCHIIPPVDQAYGRTYSAATYLVGGGARTAQFSFKGTGIYVFFILANNVPNAGTETLCKFILDGQPSGDYSHFPSQSSDYEYHVPVYSKSNLPNKDHTLIIAADGYDRLSFINFDYAIYTYEDDTVSSQLPAQHPAPSQLTSNRAARATSQPAFGPTTQSTPPTVTLSPHTTLATISGSVITQVTFPQSQDSNSRSFSGSASIEASDPTQTLLSSSTSGVVVNNTAASHTQKIPIAALVGGVVGGVLLILAFIVLFIYFCRRSRKAQIVRAPALPTRPPTLVPFTLTNASNHSQEISEKRSGMLPGISSKRKHRKRADYPTLGSSSTHARSETPLLQSLSQSSLHKGEKSNQSTSSHKPGSYSRSSTSRHDGVGVSRLVQENQAMRAQIEQLHSQLDSEHALQPLSDAPPGYSKSETS